MSARATSGPSLPPAITSLIEEDLHAIPAGVLATARLALVSDPHDSQARLDACLAALAAGEPKRALDFLGAGNRAETRGRPLPWRRIQAAITAWARQLDTNRYPGGVGAEGKFEIAGMFIEPSPGQPLEMLLEHVVSYGPVALSTPRTILEGVLRHGDTLGVEQAVGSAFHRLNTLARFAENAEYPDIVNWTLLAKADIARRSGFISAADELLAQCRSQMSAVGDLARLALSFLVEGDWHATPGSSPEALGWDLAPQENSSPLPRADFIRAADCWERAAQTLNEATVTLGLQDPSRFRAALGLRRAFLARSTEGLNSRRSHLRDAMAASLKAGDGAAYHLVAMHLLVADVDEGRLTQHALDLGGGWQPPTRGPVAELLEWERTVGSKGWTVGLGRLLERCADMWRARGDAARSRVAYLAALHLMSVDPPVPARQIATQVAAADLANNLASTAVLRLERAYAPVLSAESADDHLFAFPLQLEATNVLVNALNIWSRGPGAYLAASRLASLAEQLRVAYECAARDLPPSHENVPRTMDELREALGRLRGDGSLEAGAVAGKKGAVLMRRMQLLIAEGTLRMIEVLVPTIYARAADQAGQPTDARHWAARAIEAASGPGAEPFLLPLALISDNRLEEARAAVDAATDELADDLELTLRVQVKDYAGAAVLAEKNRTTWPELLACAEAELGLGRTAEAEQSCEAAIAGLEELVARLVREPDRIDACDQPNVAALFTTLALTHLATESPDSAEAGASFDAAERARTLTDDEELEAVDAGLRQTWQRTAAVYSATANRILSRNSTISPSQRSEAYGTLDAAEVALAKAELAMDAASPGVLIRRAARRRPPGSSHLRNRMPEDVVLLEYLAVGEDLIAWAVTRETVRPVRHKVRFRRLTAVVRTFHSACTEGHAPTSELTELLLEPFADLLHAHRRVVVVPFGPLNLVPFHALRVNGMPLALTNVVSYAPSATRVFHPDSVFDRPVTATRPLVVGDPDFDRATHPGLRELPGARAEAAAVATRLRATWDAVLVGPAATEAAVTQRLATCDLLHVSSHAHLDDLSPYSSSLVLAGRDELTVADIAGLGFGTDLAVLTGCDTGRGAATLGGDVVGLTRALLRSGVRQAVVSLWPVDDAIAPIVMDHFYTHLSQGLPPAYALTEAQRATYSLDAAGLRAAFGALGGDRDAVMNQRRGEWLDPALRDTENLPEELGGDAERFWAPFVLVG